MKKWNQVIRYAHKIWNSAWRRNIKEGKVCLLRYVKQNGGRISFDDVGVSVVINERP